MTRKVEGECWYHSQECSRGQGAVLLVSQSLVLVFNTRYVTDKLFPADQSTNHSQIWLCILLALFGRAR